ncbi:MAG: hypothetical protein CME64_10145 [Halobacteriovoraceae bacterium]|nr:hypothetical protein [Halobacteriovoraceae bacterium]|tara:strand:+ start:112637 stop:113239 length:603 start_codon:yes stop_codon:yes gene_type:complete
MNKLDKLLLKYIVFGFPFVVGLMIWGGLGDASELSRSSGVVRIVWDCLGWNLMAWILVSLYFTSKVVISKGFRSTTLKAATKMRERDEREVLINGNAAKFSFLSTLAILFLFLFMSLFTVTVGKNSDVNEVVGEKRNFISIGLNLYPFDDKSNSVKSADGVELVNYSGLPLSNSMMFMFLILWQVASFKIAVKREESVLD